MSLAMARGKRHKITPHQKPEAQHGAPRAVQNTSGNHAVNPKSDNVNANDDRRLPSNILPPFEQDARILLIGEGDFSFSRSLLDEHGCYNITATCLDSQSELFAKYEPQAEENVNYLRAEDQYVFCNIDATKLDSDKQLDRHVRSVGAFDFVVFNFPHVGGKSKDVNRQVRLNQEMLVGFFKSCQKLLTLSDSSEGGKIMVTLFEGEPYTLWNVRDLARHSGLELVKSFRFIASTYPGYKHARTLGNIDGGGGWKGEDRQARTFVFRRKSDSRANIITTSSSGQSSQKRKRRASDSEQEDD